MYSFTNGEIYILFDIYTRVTVSVCFLLLMARFWYFWHLLRWQYFIYITRKCLTAKLLLYIDRPRSKSLITLKICCVISKFPSRAQWETNKRTYAHTKKQQQQITIQYTKHRSTADQKRPAWVSELFWLNFSENE